MSADNMHEYAFDVKLFAVVRVRAACKEDAIDLMNQVVDGLTPSDAWVERFNEQLDDVCITEVSLSEDGEGENREPFEIDGEMV